MLVAQSVCTAWIVLSYNYRTISHHIKSGLNHSPNCSFEVRPVSWDWQLDEPTTEHSGETYSTQSRKSGSVSFPTPCLSEGKASSTHVRDTTGCFTLFVCVLPLLSCSLFSPPLLHSWSLGLVFLEPSEVLLLPVLDSGLDQPWSVWP